MRDLKPNLKKAGFIAQGIRAFAFLDGALERFFYTKPRRIKPNRKIEQQGDGDFFVPKQWMRDRSGRFQSAISFGFIPRGWNGN